MTTGLIETFDAQKEKMNKLATQIVKGDAGQSWRDFEEAKYELFKIETDWLDKYRYTNDEWAYVVFDVPNSESYSIARLGQNKKTCEFWYNDEWNKDYSTKFSMREVEKLLSKTPIHKLQKIT